MQNLSLLLKIGLEEDLIGFFFGFAEDDSTSVASTVEVNDVCDD